MPLLSIVVPAYQVAPYVASCLDSLLEAPGADLEVVAVDDCSPDRTGQILDCYARRDPRVTVLHLEHNVGLGTARNIGLAHARGDYVWFVDSDDWVATHAVAAIARRLTELTPDVLVIDYARAYWDLRTTRNHTAPILAAAPAGTFRTVDHPRLLRVFPGAWNKIVRREFLHRHDLRFPTGYYEDLAFTYPLLCIAERIAVLDRVCLYYRQRRHGSILGSHGRQHLVLLDQYRLVFERLHSLGEPARPLLPAVYDRAVEHLLMMLGRHGRLDRSALPTFFTRAGRLCRRYRPDGWREPTGIDRLRYRLLVGGSWPRFRLLRDGYHALRAARRSARGALRRTRAWLRRPARVAARALLHGYYRLHTLLPVDRRLAVYSIYWDGGYGDNCAAIYEKALELAPEVHGVWVVTRSAARRLPAGVDHVVRNTPRYFRVLARAGYLINNVNYPDFVLHRAGSVHLQTHHGTPLKLMGVDQRDTPVLADRTDYPALLRRCRRWDYALSANPHSSQVWERAYPCGVELLEYGFPRNDLLVDPPSGLAAALRARLGIGADERVVLYAPTHREYRADTDPLVDYEALTAALGPGSRLLVRAHHFDRGPGRVQAHLGCQVLDVSDHPRVEELYLIADVLITDYSSVMFDYAILDRPIIVHAPDWPAFRAVRGAYFDLPAAPPGVLTRTEAELVDTLATGRYAGEAADTARAEFRHRYCRYDDGHAAERVVRRLFTGPPPELPAAARRPVDEANQPAPTGRA